MKFVACPSCSVSVPATDDNKCVHCGAPLPTHDEKKAHSPADRLTAEAEEKLADMIEGQRHPDRINAFLLGEGMEPAELEDVYESFGVSMQTLRRRHREKRRMQLIGAMILAFGLLYTIASLRAGWIVGIGILAIIVGAGLLWGSHAARPQRVDRSVS